MQYVSCLAGRVAFCAALAPGAAGPVFGQPVSPGASALSLQESFASVADYYKTRVVSVTAERVVRSAATTSLSSATKRLSIPHTFKK